jgi:hypothetical protein
MDQLGTSSLKNISSDVLGKKGADYKSYAWSGAVPDSAGLEFVGAAAALTGVASSTAGTTLNTTNVLPFTTEQYLEPVFKALDKGIEAVGEVGENMAATTVKLAALETGEAIAEGAAKATVVLALVEAGVNLGIITAEYIEKEKQAEEYDKMLAEAKEPLSVKEIMESGSDNDKRSLLLFWSLATSPYSSNAKLSQGKIPGAALCQRDDWSKLECAQAKGTIAAAATIAAATMAVGN